MSFPTRQSKRGLRTATLLGMSVLLVFGLLSFPHPTLAQSQALDLLADFAVVSRLPETPLLLIVARLVRAALSLVGIILTILILYGGFVWMTSGGNPDRINRAKAILKNALIGVVIIMFSWAIASFVIRVILDATGTNGSVVNIAQTYNEPLSASLGAGAIQDHYPPRNALDIARNTKIFVTFKDEIDHTSIVQDVDNNPATPEDVAVDINGNSAVEIFQTADPTTLLPASDVTVSVSLDRRTFVFTPKNLLGNGIDDINYTVRLTPQIQKVDPRNPANSVDVFTGQEGGGYKWNFEVGTTVDLTPPQVISVIPVSQSNPYPRNTTIQMNFNEAMDPVAGTGVFDGVFPDFTNIEVLTSAGTGVNVTGEFKISNGYRTIEFQPSDACGSDPCGNTIFCLPPTTLNATETLLVLAHAATVVTGQEPQADISSGFFDGLVDAASNSLDGNGDGQGSGPSSDNYAWQFTTNSTIDATPPMILSLAPFIGDSYVDPIAPIVATFENPLLGSSVTGSNVQLWPDTTDPQYHLWFVPHLSAPNVIELSHPALVSRTDGGYDYYPLFSEGIRGNNQICFYESRGPDAGNTGTCAVTPALPYCCDGVPSATNCITRNGAVLPLGP